MLIAADEAGRAVKRPSGAKVGAMLANLRRGNAHLVLERVDEEVVGDWYVQVLLRDDNIYQLEYRDGTAREHYQTRTVSQEKVLMAMLGWAAGRADWRDALMWNNIASECEAPEVPWVGAPEAR